jgi:small conductance mechanosensitive channel
MHVLQTTDTCTGTGAYVCRAAVDLTGNTRAGDISQWLIGRPLSIIGLVLVAVVVRWILHKLVDRLVSRASRSVLPERVHKLSLGSMQIGRPAVDRAGATRRVQRAQTMGTLLKSIVSGVVFAIFGTMVLAELGLDIAPIIASAGIIGIALGFGAQSLVSDFLSGIFMIFEDQYGVGDVVDLGEAVGTVEAVSLRVTRVRDVNGTVWYVRNGEILRVGNQSQNWARTVLDVSVAYDEDLVKVQRVLRDVAHDLWDDEDFKGVIIEEPEVWGVEALTPDGVTVRVTLKTAPLEQWRVAREMRERIKARFDFEKIEIPYPQRVIWQREGPSSAAVADES